MVRTKILMIGTLALAASMAQAQTSQFNADSAYAFTEHLSVTIGPRPMGSANERAALEWTVDKFNSFGADTAYVLPFTKARQMVNTNSGTAVGVFRGQTDSTIVIGGHVDSSGREIPGANDDASGTAAMIELARIWSKQPRHYTMVFAAFGGEEQGLVGSRHFADNFAQIDEVVLMLQIDMVGSEDNLITFLETKDRQAPQWLVEDAFEMGRALELEMQYPTRFFAINTALPGGAGSDHEPFLAKDIPAIDFTAGIINSAIHTQQDKFEFISKPMMGRSGSLVNGLIIKYQTEGIPAAGPQNYVLWNLFGVQLFTPPWLIGTFTVVSLVLGTVALIRSRKQRLVLDKSERARFSGMKLFVMLIVIAISAQVGEAFLQLFKGLRYPWVVHLDKYLWFAAVSAIAGVWVALQLSRKWRLSTDPHVYAVRALILLFTFIILLGMGSVRLTAYPALTLTLFALAILLRSPALKSVLCLIAPLPMFQLMFMEVFAFGSRATVGLGFNVDSFGEALFYGAVLTIILVVWYLPAVYLYSYLSVAVEGLRKGLRQLRRPAFGVAILAVMLGFGGYLYSLPAYNEVWRASINVDAEYDIRTGKNSVLLAGNEYFRGVTAQTESSDASYDGKVHKDSLDIGFSADWLDVSGEETVVAGERDTLKLDWLIVSQKPWYLTTLEVRVDTLEISDVVSDLNLQHQRNRIATTWYAEPPDTLRVEASFTVHPGARIIREVSAEYPVMPFPIEVTAELADVRYRTTVVYRDTLDLASKRLTAN